MIKVKEISDSPLCRPSTLAVDRGRQGRIHLLRGAPPDHTFHQQSPLPRAQSPGNELLLYITAFFLHCIYFPSFTLCGDMTTTDIHNHTWTNRFADSKKTVVKSNF